MRKLTTKELRAIESRGGKVVKAPTKPKAPKLEKASIDQQVVKQAVEQSVVAANASKEAVSAVSAIAADMSEAHIRTSEALIAKLQEVVNSNVQRKQPVRLKVNRVKGLIESIDVLPLTVKQ